jgi:hypothetical protein
VRYTANGQFDLPFDFDGVRGIVGKRDGSVAKP